MFKGMLGLLSLVFIVLVFLAPYLLHKKWNVPTDVLPLLYQFVMVVGIGVLVYAMIKVKGKVALKMVGVLATGLMIGVVVFILPGINAVASPKFIMTEVQSFLKNPSDPILTFQHWNWRNDEDLYYWQHVHKSADIVGAGLGQPRSVGNLTEKSRTQWFADHLNDRTAISEDRTFGPTACIDSLKRISATEQENLVGLPRGPSLNPFPPVPGGCLQHEDIWTIGV